MYSLFSFRRIRRFLSRVNQIFRHSIVNTRFNSTDYDIVEKQFYAFENYGQDTKLAWMFMYGVSGLLIPASLSTALTITEGGYINVRNNVIDLDWVQFTKPICLVCSILGNYFSFIYFIRVLTYYAKKANDEPAYNLTRQWHIF